MQQGKKDGMIPHTLPVAASNCPLPPYSVLLISAPFSLAGSAFTGRSKSHAKSKAHLQKGNLVGTHVMSVTLNPGVTMDQFLDFYTKKVIPIWEKNYVGWKFYLVKSIRGEIKDSYGTIIVIKSEKDRDKYFNPDASHTKLGTEAMDKSKSVMDELNKLGTFTYTYTDWLVH